MDKKRIANNILELMIDPTRVRPERRLYFRPEEKLDNRLYESAKAEANQAYGIQRYNTDFYPQRNRSREVFSMDRRTLIASFDILSQNFKKEDPIAKELRTMAYAVDKMSDDELDGRLSEEIKGEEARVASKYTDFVKKYLKDNPDKGIADAAKEWKKKAAEEEIVEEKESKKKNNDDETEKWSSDATDAVKNALVSDILDIDLKQAGKKKGPGKPDGTGPYGDTSECQMNEDEKKEAEAKEEKGEAEVKEEKEEAEESGKQAEVKEEKEEAEESGKQTATKEEKEEAEESGKQAEAKEEKEEAEEEPSHQEEKKEADKFVDTDILSSSDMPSTANFDGIEIGNPMASSEAENMEENEKTMLDQLFKNADYERLGDEEKAKLDQLFK